MPSDLAVKLRQKVCAYANVSSSGLPNDASAWLSTKTEEWVASRTVCDATMRKAAVELKQRFPSLPQRRAGSANPHPMRLSSGDVKRAMAHLPAFDGGAPLLPTRSATTEPQVLSDKPKPVPLSISSLSSYPGASAAAPHVSSSPLIAGSLRPQVIRRLQRLNDDAAIIEAVEKERAAIEHERNVLLQEKLRRQATVRQEMQLAEEQRVAKLERERNERDRLRLQVEAQIHETRMAEEDEKQLKKIKKQRERLAIEEQSIQKLQYEAEMERREREELQRQRIYASKKEREALLNEIDHASRLKEAMMQALEEGKSAARERAANRRLPKETFATAFIGGASSVGDGIENAKSRARQREALQAVVCAQYQDIQRSKWHRLEQMDHSIEDAQKRQQREAELREFGEKQRVAALRSQLVTSLEDEISRRHEKRILEISAKQEMRRELDEAAAEMVEKERLAKLMRLQQQQQRRAQIDAQLVSRVQKMISPLAVKI